MQRESTAGSTKRLRVFGADACLARVSWLAYHTLDAASAFSNL